MTTITPIPPTDEPRRRALRAGHTLRSGHVIYWWMELVCIGAYYAIYTSIRNLTNANHTSAFRHARQVIDLERKLGIYQEHALHAWARDIRPLIITCNYFYGSLHFIVTIGVGIFLFRRFPDDYPRWRNALAIATGLALIGFYTYQLMPPRLLPESYGFIDTLAKDPAFWSFNSGAMSKLSNQYAAMPSVHCAWALWCACALIPRLRRPWAKVLAGLYPVMTVMVIVFTANHYVLDAVGGFAILGIGYVVASRRTSAGVVRPPTNASTIERTVRSASER